MGDFIPCLNCIKITQKQAWWSLIYFAWMKSMYFREYVCGFSRQSHYFCILGVSHLKSNSASLPCSQKLCVSFHCHEWIQIRVIIRKCSNWIQIIDFSAHVILKFDRWPRKTIGHHFYVTSSFVHHFVAICEFKLELQCENDRFGSKLRIFQIMWLCNLTDDLKKIYGNIAFLPL